MDPSSPYRGRHGVEGYKATTAGVLQVADSGGYQDSMQYQCTSH